MPTVLRVGRFRFFFFGNEGNEPPHIHVKASEDEAKFWRVPIQLASNYGFRANELSEIAELVADHRDLFLETWNEHFS